MSKVLGQISNYETRRTIGRTQINTLWAPDTAKKTLDIKWKIKINQARECPIGSRDRSNFVFLNSNFTLVSRSRILLSLAKSWSWRLLISFVCSFTTCFNSISVTDKSLLQLFWLSNLLVKVRTLFKLLSMLLSITPFLFPMLRLVFLSFSVIGWLSWCGWVCNKNHVNLISRSVRYYCYVFSFADLVQCQLNHTNHRRGEIVYFLTFYIILTLILSSKCLLPTILFWFICR